MKNNYKDALADIGNDYTNATYEIEFQRAYKEHGRILRKIRLCKKRLGIHTQNREQLRRLGTTLDVINMRIDSMNEHLAQYDDICKQLMDYKAEISVNAPQNRMRAAEHKIIMSAYERAYKQKAR